MSHTDKTYIHLQDISLFYKLISPPEHLDALVEAIDPLPVKITLKVSSLSAPLSLLIILFTCFPALFFYLTVYLRTDLNCFVFTLLIPLPLSFCSDTFVCYMNIYCSYYSNP